MGSQVYRETYLAALEVAHSDLDHIIEQFDMLQLRKEQLEVPWARSILSCVPPPRQSLTSSVNQSPSTRNR